ncbi:TPA: MFS transporter [Vibrio parahaemolyticus]|nr:MFS transporter [Vibrio parahaemolyticus]
MIQSIALFLIAFLVGADELLLGSILEPIGGDLGVPPSQVTLFITAYSLAIAFCAPYLGRWSDRVGSLRLMLPACFVFGISSILTGLVSQFEWALVTRVVTGIASAGMLPIAFALAGDAKGGRSMRQIVMVQAGLTLGMITSPAIGALITQLLSWRAAFIILGMAALAVGALVWGCMREPHDQNERLMTLPPVIEAFRLPGALGAIALMVCMPCSIWVFACGASQFVAYLPILAIWSLAGGIGSPALQAYIASLSDEYRGVLMSSAMSMMHFGVAIWSALAGFAYDVGSEWVAVLAVLLFGFAIAALKPIQETEQLQRYS